MPVVRPAIDADVDAMVDLLERRRDEYERYQPVFWKKTDDSAERTGPFFRSLLGNDKVTALVAHGDAGLAGFLIAIETPAPPVYAPGGPTVLVDDFCVAAGHLWPTVGRALLERLETIGRQAGWRQYVVVCGQADEAKSAFLASTRLSLASTWWTTTF